MIRDHGDEDSDEDEHELGHLLYARIVLCVHICSHEVPRTMFGTYWAFNTLYIFLN